MSIVYMEQIRGMPYLPKKRLEEEFSMSKMTVNRRIDGIRHEIEKGRYSPYALLDSGNLLVNAYVFVDYLKYRKMLSDKNMRKYVPEFKPDEIMRISGYSQKVVTLDEESEEVR